MSKDVIIALDFPDKLKTMNFIKQFDERLFVKVGMELFYKEGPGIIHELKDLGHQIFLDLKLHDIPNTVYQAMMNIASYEADMVNVHALGGKKMMEQALNGLEAGSKGKRPICIAVTLLTSLSEEAVHEELHIQGQINEIINHYAKLTKEAGLDGVVCSPIEAKMIHENLGREFITVTPGIRLAEDSQDDQKRIATPAVAKSLGADYIVVGRSITKADNPRTVYELIKNQFIK